MFDRCINTLIPMTVLSLHFTPASVPTISLWQYPSIHCAQYGSWFWIFYNFIPSTALKVHYMSSLFNRHKDNNRNIINALQGWEVLHQSVYYGETHNTNSISISHPLFNSLHSTHSYLSWESHTCRKTASVYRTLDNISEECRPMANLHCHRC